ncbi:MAG: hypothetical protein ACKPH7_16400, partial [Planktothrix sp.]|uniref:hypothetical protein n=1 Tax=Planktothrix sp. TaxID=3088171 RepID=UPI0038D50E24
MPDKKPEWSDYSYSNSDIAKRLGISTAKVEDLKAEAAKESQEEIGGDLSKNGVTAGLKINKDDLKIESARVGIEIPGLGGVSIDSQGGGEIDILSLIKVETIRIKCFYIQRFYLAGQFLFSDIQKIDSEECKDSEEPEPEPEPDPSLDDIDDDPKPRPSPKIPPYSVEIQRGIYTIKRTIFERIVDDSTKYLSIYKGFVSSNAVRMYFHESPVLDLWQINTQVRVSHTIVNPKPLDAPFSYSADRTIYYCESPETLASRNIIIKKAINTYNYQDSEVLHSLWVVPLKRNTPYGQVAWAPGHDGVSSNNRKFSSLLGIWAGGVILEGNSQSVPYFLRNGFVSKINEE